MIVVAPVIQTGEKEQQVANTHVQHVVNAVEVEKSDIIEETRQKPIIQEKINQVTKHVEIPLLQFMNKVVDIPVVAQRTDFRGPDCSEESRDFTVADH